MRRRLRIRVRRIQRRRQRRAVLPHLLHVDRVQLVDVQPVRLHQIQSATTRAGDRRRQPVHPRLQRVDATAGTVAGSHARGDDAQVVGNDVHFVPARIDDAQRAHTDMASRLDRPQRQFAHGDIADVAEHRRGHRTVGHDDTVGTRVDGAATGRGHIAIDLLRQIARRQQADVAAARVQGSSQGQRAGHVDAHMTGTGGLQRGVDLGVAAGDQHQRAVRAGAHPGDGGVTGTDHTDAAIDLDTVDRDGQHAAHGQGILLGQKYAAGVAADRRQRVDRSLQRVGAAADAALRVQAQAAGAHVDGLRTGAVGIDDGPAGGKADLCRAAQAAVEHVQLAQRDAATGRHQPLVAVVADQPGIGLHDDGAVRLRVDGGADGQRAYGDRTDDQVVLGQQADAARRAGDVRLDVQIGCAALVSLHRRQQHVRRTAAAGHRTLDTQAAIARDDGDDTADTADVDGLAAAAVADDAQPRVLDDVQAAADRVARGQAGDQRLDGCRGGADAGGRVERHQRGIQSQVGPVAAQAVADRAVLRGQADGAVRFDAAQRDGGAGDIAHRAGVVGGMHRTGGLAVGHDDGGAGDEADRAALSGDVLVLQQRAGTAGGDAHTTAAGHADAAAADGDGAAGGDQLDTAAAARVGLLDAADLQCTARRRLGDADVTARADVHGGQRVHFGIRQGDAGGGAGVQVGGTDRFAADAVVVPVGLRDRAAGRIQHDVLQRAAQTGLHLVVQGDVGDRVQFEIVVHQQRVQRRVVVLHGDAAAVDFHRIAEGRLVLDVHRTDAHVAGAGDRMAAGFMADHDAAEAVGQTLDLGDVDVQRVRGHAQWRRGHLDVQAERARPQRQRSAATHRLAGAGEVDLVGLDEQMAGLTTAIDALQAHAGLEAHLGRAMDGQAAAAVDDHRLLEQHRTFGADRERAIDRDFAVERDVVGSIDGAADIHAADGQAAERIVGAHCAEDADVARRVQRQAVGGAGAIAIQCVAGVAAQLQMAGAVTAGGDGDVAVDAHRIADQHVVRGGRTGRQRRGMAGTEDGQRPGGQRCVDEHLAAELGILQHQIVREHHRLPGVDDADDGAAVVTADDQRRVADQCRAQFGQRGGVQQDLFAFGRQLDRHGVVAARLSGRSQQRVHERAGLGTHLRIERQRIDADLVHGRGFGWNAQRADRLRRVVGLRVGGELEITGILEQVVTARSVGVVAHVGRQDGLQGPHHRIGRQQQARFQRFDTKSGLHPCRQRLPGAGERVAHQHGCVPL